LLRISDLEGHLSLMKRQSQIAWTWPANLAAL
jgi:hypothetical protein